MSLPLTERLGNDIESFITGRIAQLEERRPYKPNVAGSSPAVPTLGDIAKWKGAWLQTRRFLGSIPSVAS